MMSISNINDARVRLTITSRHITLDPSRMGRFASLFASPDPVDEDGEIAPEDYPEEMNDALREIMAQNGEMEDEDDPAVLEFLRRCDEFAEMIREDDAESDVIEFVTEAVMRENTDGAVEIEYREDESMDNTSTMILFDPKNPQTVSIMHSGSVMSSLVCERRRRHISVYTTPIMPFEVAVYTKTLEGGFDIGTGGTLELDYIVELRGMDIQRTMMKIRADIL